MDWWMCQFTVAVTGSAQSVVYALKFLPQWKRCWITRGHAYTRAHVYCVVVRTASCIKTLAKKTTRFAFEPSDDQDQEDVERSPPGQ